MKILLGSAGVPLMCKTNSTIDGIKTVSDLGLHALEIEFVRGIHMSNDTAKEVGKTAKDFGIELSVHAPYYVNIFSNDSKIIEASKRRILATIERASLMDAKIIVFHAGYYGNLSTEKIREIIERECVELVNIIKSSVWDNVLLGLETTGRLSQWGTLEEIVRLCKRVDGCYPYLDPAHIYARNGGKINYQKIFDQLEELKLSYVYSHFSGINFTAIEEGKGNERYHMSLQEAKGPNFEEFAKEILKRKINITLISESPILEQDSLLMKKIFENLGYKFQ